MTTTNGINSTQAPYNPTSTLGDIAGGGLGKEDFLKLLVAQLSHQDPTAPTDPSQFVAQLSQFSSLEQLVNIKSGLDLVAITQTAGTSAQMVSFIGKEVAYDGGTVSWSGNQSPVDLKFQLDAPATKVEAHVLDVSGNEIDTVDLGPMKAGAQDYSFDGTKSDGTKLTAGTYTVKITATNADGTSDDVSLRGKGTVAAVTFEGGYPQLVLADGRTLGLAQVLEILADSHATTPTQSPTSNDPNRIDDPTEVDDAHPL